MRHISQGELRWFVALGKPTNLYLSPLTAFRLVFVSSVSKEEEARLDFFIFFAENNIKNTVIKMVI